MANKIEAISHLEQFLEQLCGGGNSLDLYYTNEDLSLVAGDPTAYPQWIADGTRTVDGYTYDVYYLDTNGKEIRNITTSNLNFIWAIMNFVYKNGKVTTLDSVVLSNEVHFNDVTVTRIELLLKANSNVTGTIVVGIDNSI